MSYKKFAENDIFLNTMRAYPKVNFFVYDGKTYYNSVPEQSGSRNAYVRNAPVGFISLYEYNIDRGSQKTQRALALRLSAPLNIILNFNMVIFYLVLTRFLPRLLGSL